MRRPSRSPIDLFEEAVNALRLAPAQAWIAYYLGSLPFVLGLLFFWADMSRSAFAAGHCAPAALGMAALFVRMECWQSRFVRSLHVQITGEPLERLNSPASRRLMALQAALQPTKFLVLPVAALCLLPFASAYAFYQHLMVLDSAETSTYSSAFRAAKKPAVVWQSQNWASLTILFVLNAVVFINIGALLLIGPYLLKLVLGIDTALTRGGLAAFNTTFLVVTAGLTYLLTNPLAKAVYMLRHFYAESIESGADLRIRFAMGLKLALVAAIFLLIPMSGRAQPSTPAAGASISEDQLNRAIDEVIHRPEFTWRMPRVVRPDDDNQSWFIRTTAAALDAISNAVNRGGQAVKKFLDWLSEKWKTPGQAQGDSSILNSGRLRALVATLLALAAMIACFLLWRITRSKAKRGLAVAATVVTPAVALTSEDLTADQHPLDQWLQLARDAMARQEPRLALRALYTAGLAYLAERSLISIQRGKSNSDYARELKRRARSTPELVDLFVGNMHVFERSWYGLYDVDGATLEAFQTNLEKMRTSARV